MTNDASIHDMTWDKSHITIKTLQSRRKFLKIAIVLGSVVALGGVGYLASQILKPTQYQVDKNPPSIASIDFMLEKKDSSFNLLTKALVSDDSQIDKVLVEYSYDGYTSRDTMKKVSSNLFEDEENLPFDLNELNEQGKVKIIAKDIHGNEAFREKSFFFGKLLESFDKQNPVVNDVEFRLVDPYTLEIRAFVSDDVGVKQVGANLNIGSVSKEITLEKKDNVYVGYVNLDVKEQTISAKVYAKDYLDKTGESTVAFAYVDLLKEVDKTLPTISYRIDFLSFDNSDKIDIEFSANDDVKLKDSYVLLNGERLENLLFDLDISNLNDLNFEFVAIDLAGNKVSESLSYTTNEIYEKLFKNYVSSKGYGFNDDEVNQLLSISLIKELFGDYGLRKELENVFRYVSSSIDRINNLTLLSDFLTNKYSQNLDKAKNLFVDIVKFLDRNSIDFLEDSEKEGISNYFEAVRYNGFRSHDDSVLMKFLDMVRFDGDLVDFSDLVFDGLDKNGNPKQYVVSNFDKARDTWFFVELLYRDSEWYDLFMNGKVSGEALNSFIWGMNWSLFDFRYSLINYKYPGNDAYFLKPDDDWLWTNFFVPFLAYFKDYHVKQGKAVYPWYDKQEFSQIVSNKNERKYLIMNNARILPKIWDRWQKKVVSGKRCLELHVQYLPIIYDEIMQEFVGPNDGYWALIQKEKEFTEIEDLWEWLKQNYSILGINKYISRFIYYLNDRNYWIQMRSGQNGYPINEFIKIDAYLSESEKNEPIEKMRWYKQKFIKGWIGSKNLWGGEMYEYAYGMPTTYKSFGILNNYTSYWPWMDGVGTGEFGITISDTQKENIKQQFSSYKPTLGIGNTITFWNMIDGVEKLGNVDSVKSALWCSGNEGDNVYLWVKK